MDSKTDAHASAYSGLHTKSEFCEGCHDFSINGVPISQTYTEWKEGPYAAEGKQCQDCHMETKTAAAAKNGTIREKVYQHFWYGGHTGQFLDNAFQINSSIEKTGNRVFPLERSFWTLTQAIGKGGKYIPVRRSTPRPLSTSIITRYLTSGRHHQW
jgi:cytochrome c5